jgi:hypothetical protein
MRDKTAHKLTGKRSLFLKSSKFIISKNKITQKITAISAHDYEKKCGIKQHIN